MQTRKLILFFVISLLESCSTSEKQLPILSKYIDDKGREVIYKIENLSFIDQNNQIFSEKNVSNKTYIANFFFTRCPSICPKMKTVLKDIANEYEKASDFKITSFSIDSKYDTPEVLKLYANSTNVIYNKWFFLTGSNEELNHTAKLFRTSFSQNEDNIDFYHSSYVALVDRQKHIRGFYNLLEPASVNKLKKDLKKLLK